MTLLWSHPAHAGYVEGRSGPHWSRPASRLIPRMRAMLKVHDGCCDRCLTSGLIPRTRAALKDRYVEGAERIMDRPTIWSHPATRATLKFGVVRHVLQGQGRVSSRACGLR